MTGVRRRTPWLELIALGLVFAPSCEDGDRRGTGGMGGSTTISSSGAGSTNSTSVGPGSSSGDGLPAMFTVTGIVTNGQTPIAGAMVMQGGGKPLMETGPDGTFAIEVTRSIPGTPTVVAAKIGYRSNGVEFLELPSEPIEIVLHQVSPPDNISGYTYGEPGVGDPDIDTTTGTCGHCHTTLVAQFHTSAHAKATRDPLVQDIYAGTTTADANTCAAMGGIFRSGRIPGSEMGSAQKCYLGGGVLPDLNGCGGPNDLACDDPQLNDAQKPTQFGHCADCHAAGLPGPTGGRNLLDATGNVFDNGNHCDVCHKVSDIDLSKPPGVAGRLVLQRPRETLNEPGGKLRQVMFGPLPDVPLDFMGGSYQPKFSQATFCAGCHEQQQEALVPGMSVNTQRFPDGLPTHSTYTEWAESPWAAAGAQCQHCHMPPNKGLVNTLDTMKAEKASIAYGFPRPPEQIRSHVFRGPLAGAPRLVDLAVGLWLDAKVVNGDVLAQVKVSNQSAGHALPTGEPMRAMLLVVQAFACGQRLTPKNGALLDDVGGVLAEGTVGQGISAAGTSWTWNAATMAKAGQTVRVVRDTGQWVDYPGIGYFADPMLGPADKGIPLRAPVGEAQIVSAMNGVITLDRELPVQAGDLVWLGEQATNEIADGAVALALAGSAGQSFARVLVDAGGERLVPHYKAVDIVSDNRLPPLEPITTTHEFAIPMGCNDVSVTATILYRPVPLHLGRLRGWETRDWVAATRKEQVLIP